MTKNFLSLFIFGLFLSCSSPTDEIKTTQSDSKKESEAGTTRTPGYSDTKNAYFGDLHIHTSWSFDAFIYNVRTTPDDAYKFAKGSPIPHVAGGEIQIKRPLDFLAVADHAEYMGIFAEMGDKESALSKTELAKAIFNDNAKVARKAFGQVGMTIATNQPIKELVNEKVLKNTWKRMVEAADRHYQPGEFTTFPAYEWTSSVGVVEAKPQYAKNLHRNVIFKNSNVPEIPFSSFNSQNPEKLWEWMDMQRKEGIEVLAIPHNANISDGAMFPSVKFNGDPIDEEYAKSRMRNEPVNEVVQIKGQSMTHPILSPNDEFANFEVYTHTLGRKDPRRPSQPNGSYARQAFKNGLAMEQKLGTNPYQFGVIGSTDCHNGASNFREDYNFGKSGVQDPTPEVRLANDNVALRKRETSVSGLAGVWAKENTRESIFESFQRKEVFATSGPRIKVRLFAGWDFQSVDIQSDRWLDAAYSKGVPMGSDLSRSSSGKAPQFLIWASKDAESANLDRVQVIKGWVDADGKTHEKIYDVAWSEGRKKVNGKLPAIENTVDIKTATYKNTVGAINLQTVWTDPDFDATHAAFYYVRVLEIPTPRWTTYDAATLGVDVPKEVPATIQERAWSSPIWYKP
jgi:hypothetical protein